MPLFIDVSKNKEAVVTIDETVKALSRICDDETNYRINFKEDGKLEIEIDRSDQPVLKDEIETVLRALSKDIKRGELKAIFSLDGCSNNVVVAHEAVVELNESGKPINFDKKTTNGHLLFAKKKFDYIKDLYNQLNLEVGEVKNRDEVRLVTSTFNRKYQIPLWSISEELRGDDPYLTVSLEVAYIDKYLEEFFVEINYKGDMIYDIPESIEEEIKESFFAYLDSIRTGVEDAEIYLTEKMVDVLKENKNFLAKEIKQRSTSNPAVKCRSGIKYRQMPIMKK